jgi:hypothetical protein
MLDDMIKNQEIEKRVERKVPLFGVELVDRIENHPGPLRSSGFDLNSNNLARLALLERRESRTCTAADLKRASDVAGNDGQDLFCRRIELLVNLLAE